MPQRLADGSLIYTAADADVAAVTLNGVSVIDLAVIEAKVCPDGWGRITTKKRLGFPNDPVKVLKDGQIRCYMYWGEVTVT